MNETIISSATVVTPALTGGAILVIATAIIAIVAIFNTQNGQFRQDSMLSDESPSITPVGAYKVRRYVFVATIVILATGITGTFVLLMMAL